MKKLVLLLAVSLVIITISMSSSSEPEMHDPPCDEIFTLKCDLVEDMKQKYEITQRTYINASLRFDDGYGDSKAAWLPIKVLKQFICQIEKEEIKATGVRFYYASYPEKGKWGDYPDLRDEAGKDLVDIEYAERHTLILIPTVNKVDYVPNAGDIIALGIGDDERPSRNHGELYPPDDLIETKCD